MFFLSADWLEGWTLSQRKIVFPTGFTGSIGFFGFLSFHEETEKIPIRLTAEVNYVLSLGTGE